MAYAVEVTLGTGNKVSLNYQSQEVNVSVTYKLEREDTDVMAVVQDKADELVRAHTLAWKRVKEGERPEAAKEEEKLADEAPIVEDAKEHEIENGAIENGAIENGVIENRATATQVRLIHSMGQQAGLSEDELRNRIRDDYKCEVPEELKRDEAAKILVELGHEERERFERERSRSSRRREPDEETIS